jgi:DNA-binding XRE family transcriptional regulator
MDPSKISERTRRQLEKLPPEKRAKAEAAAARTQTSEFRAQAAAARAMLDREYRETGRIATIGDAADAGDAQRFIMDLRRIRETQGLSLADVAERSGIDKAALSRLENGQQPKPTVNTLARYAHAVGKRLAWSMEEVSASGDKP